jgi:hypothetical protein
MRQGGKIFLYLGAAVVVAFVIGEAAARSALPWFRAHWPNYYHRTYLERLALADPVLLWTGRPHMAALVRNSQNEDVTYELNALGWREDELAHMEGRPGRRVLLLGDSYSFGSGVSARDRFSESLERLLPDTQVWNAGVIGYSVDHYYLLAERWLQRRKWDALILQLSNNDLADLAGHDWFNAEGELAPADQLPAWLGGWKKNNLFRHSSELWGLVHYIVALTQNEPLPAERITASLGRFESALRGVLERARAEGVPVILLQATDWGENSYGRETAMELRRMVRGLAKKYETPLFEPYRNFTLVDLLPYPDLNWRVATHTRVAELLSPYLKTLFQPRNRRTLSRLSQLRMRASAGS